MIPQVRVPARQASCPQCLSPIPEGKAKAFSEGRIGCACGCTTTPMYQTKYEIKLNNRRITEVLRTAVPLESR